MVIPRSLRNVVVLASIPRIIIRAEPTVMIRGESKRVLALCVAAVFGDNRAWLRNYLVTFLCALVPLLLLFRRGAALSGGRPAVCGRATCARPSRRGSLAAAHIASAFCNRVTQYSHARSTPRPDRLWAPHFSRSPGVSGAGVPMLMARSCNSALRVE